LVLLASKACNYQGRDHITLAAMIEFMHTATLLHDDVVDDSTLRRGQQTANDIWGSKASILVGDYLLTQCLNLMITTQSWPIMKLMSDTMHQLTLGEVKQLSNRGNYNLSVDDYFETIRSKTALLFAASAGMGAILGETSDATQKSLYDYGLHLGNAFQLIDDVLDYSADAETMGKNTGDDLAEGVITMPLLHTMQHGSKEEQALIKQSFEKGSLERLPEILNAIKANKALEATKALAIREMDLALTNLAVLPESIYKDALISLAKFAVERGY
jgi:octaprenyl-diphosphate synthase